MANANVSNKPGGSKAKNEPKVIERESKVPTPKGGSKVVKMQVKTN